MTETLTKTVSSSIRDDTQKVTYADLRGLSVRDAERRIEPFLTWLRGLSASRRRALASTDFSRCELWIWARHFPSEVPLINGEYPWIALRLPHQAIESHQRSCR